MKTTLLALCILVAPFRIASADDSANYSLFENTISPDGHFALAWGTNDRAPIDVSDPDRLFNEMDLNNVANFIIDLKTRKIIATVGTQFFSAGDRGQNHGSLSASWRNDSLAVMIVAGGKWEFENAAIAYVAENENAFDILPVTEILRRSVKSQILKNHPKEKSAINNFAISVRPEKWTSATGVLLSITGEVPKSEDAFFYEGYMTVTFPDAPLLTVIDAKAPRDIMAEGSMGGIKIDSPATALSGLGKPIKGEDTIWEAIGAAVQEWNFPDAGLTINMISEKVGGAKTVFTITAKTPCKLKTGMDIGIGSTKDEVVRAYADFKTEKEELQMLSDDKNTHLVGSIYGGMIFTFKDGKVTEIFFGAAAE